MTSVGTVDPAKITANHSVVFNSGVLANERSFIKSKRKANVPFTFAELKEVGENACSGDGRTKIRKDKGSPHLGPSISGYDLPGQCAAITEAVLVRACNVARARVWCSCVCAPPNQWYSYYMNVSTIPLLIHTLTHDIPTCSSLLAVICQAHRGYLWRAGSAQNQKGPVHVQLVGNYCRGIHV